MKLGNSLKRYEQEIWNSVLHYAYANYHPTPLMEQIEIEDWCGEIFNVKDLDKELHFDLIEDLKALELYDNIKKNCDKFVILPDVWSQSNVPISADRNQYDMDRANVVIINNKIFELVDITMKSIKYNHNKLMYCFYKDSLSQGIFNVPSGKKPQMSVLWVYENSFIVDNVKLFPDLFKVPEGDEWFKFCLNKDNKLTPVDNNIDRVGIALNCQYLEFDYNKEVDPRVEVHVPGLASFSKDSWIEPKIWNIDDENRVFVHNKHLIFTNTFLVIFKDNTYKIENTYSREKDTIIEKIDKHTIRMEKDDRISKIIVFVKPFDPDRYPLPDNLYYKATDKNMYSAIRLKVHKKYTNDLYLAMTRQEGVDLDYIIDYGYKYDLDVLKCIQQVFNTVHNLNVHKDVDVRDIWGAVKPKILVHCWNKLQMYPLLFINHRLYPADYRIIKSDDSDSIVLDPEQAFRILNNGKLIAYDYVENLTMVAGDGTLPDYVPPKPEVDKYMNKEWILNNFQKLVEDIKVVFVPYGQVNDENETLQNGRIFRTPLYKNDLILDEPGMVGDNIRYKGWQFVDGYLSNETFKHDLFRRLDGINIYDYGELNFTVTASNNPSDNDVYHIENTGNIVDSIKVKSVEVIPDSVEVNYNATIKITLDDPEDTRYKASIYNGNNTTVLINRLNNPINQINKVWLGNNHIVHVSEYKYGDTMYPADDFKRLKEYSTLIFDKYGVECTDKVDILSSKYLSVDNMYNYVGNDEVYEQITIHMFPNTLNSKFSDYDLEIDEPRIKKYLNKGFYNDNALEDINVRALFLPNEPSEVRAIPVSLKSNHKLLGEKILTRYWLGYKGSNIPNIEQFNKEIASLNGTYIKAGGLLGNVPDDVKPFLSTDNLRGETHLGQLYTSLKAITKTFESSGITGVTFDENFINSNMDYKVNVDHTLPDNTAIIRMSNDIIKEAK